MKRAALVVVASGTNNLQDFLHRIVNILHLILAIMIMIMIVMIIFVMCNFCHDHHEHNYLTDYDHPCTAASAEFNKIYCLSLSLCHDHHQGMSVVSLIIITIHHRPIIIIGSPVNHDDPAGFSAEIFKYPAGPKTSSSVCFDHLDCHDHNDQNYHINDLL